MGDVDTTTCIVISVQDQLSNSDAFSPYDHEVTSNCTAPTISGNPVGTIDSGLTYSFTPYRQQCCGTLEFSIQNKPEWVGFNTFTGELYGCPTSADVGTTTDIIISEEDVSTKVIDLLAFEIEVASITAVNSAGGSSGGVNGGGDCFISSIDN